MLKIQNLRIQWQGGDPSQAQGLGQLVAQQLAQLPVSAEGHIERLQPPPVTIKPGTSQAELATQIARAIATQIETQGGAL